MRDSIGTPLTPCFICKGWVSSGGEEEGRGGGGELRGCAWTHTQDVYTVIVLFWGRADE